jgi:hypothetical protein
VSRVLLAWELGSNLGHVSRLAPIARRLMRSGDDVRLVVRDVELLRTAAGDLPCTISQSPRVDARRAPVPWALNYADVLDRHGYGCPTTAAALLGDWLTLIREQRPDVLIGEHSPGALLAARLAGIPAVAIGTGYTVPPGRDPMPTVQPWFEVTDERLRARERALLDALNTALARMGAEPLARVADIFGGATKLICAWPELDHYASSHRTDETFVGPAAEGMGMSIAAGGLHRPRVFAYGRGPRWQDAVRVAIGRGCAVVAYAPSWPPAQRPSGKHVRWLDCPMAIRNVAAEFDLALCESPGTATAFLLSGVPSVVVPRQLEQELWAYRVGGRGLIAVVPLLGPADDSTLPARFDQALDDTHFRARVREFARRTVAETPDSIETIVTACRRL